MKNRVQNASRLHSESFKILHFAVSLAITIKIVDKYLIHEYIGRCVYRSYTNIK